MTLNIAGLWTQASQYDVLHSFTHTEKTSGNYSSGPGHLSRDLYHRSSGTINNLPLSSSFIYLQPLMSFIEDFII